jgi:hypothetical protein
VNRLIAVFDGESAKEQVGRRRRRRVTENGGVQQVGVKDDECAMEKCSLQLIEGEYQAIRTKNANLIKKATKKGRSRP